MVLALTLLPGVAAACTTVAFTEPARPVMAYNLDFHIGQGLVLINKRDLEKISETAGNPARWHAAYASVTFTMFGRDSPMSGMNEKGLAASQMWLDEARYEASDARPTIGVLEWLQYVLDTSATVEEALVNIGKVRIASRIPLHYKLMDASGNAAVIEFLEGEAVIRRGAGLPFAALANDTYGRSLAFANEARSDGTPVGSGSLARFTRAALASKARRNPADDPVRIAFATLADVAQAGRTHWSIVYDTAKRTVYWRTRENAAVRFVDLGAFDLSCAAPTQLLDIHEGVGDVGSGFRAYHSVDNEKLLFETVRATPFLSAVDDSALRKSARWPEESLCLTK